LQTALLLLGESHKNFDSEGNLENELKIKVEPGFIENMIDCVNKPIGYDDIEELAKHHSRLDTAYVPILNREKLAQDYKEVYYIRTKLVWMGPIWISIFPCFSGF